ncbi:MAG TPA: fucose isomerase [Candidatus Atribacteria bacterium]|nr:fucose isomerase [Candidatus Atribacteria bacterium]
MKLGIISFTDGRKRVYEKTKEICFRFQKKIAAYFKEKGHEVLEGNEIVWNWETAKKQAEYINNFSPDIVVFNFSVWSFPDLTAQVAIRIDAPILFIGNINPAYPGWVAFFASAGTLDEIGIPYGRALGDIDDEKVQKKVEIFLKEHDPKARKRGIEVAEKLYGTRYGEFDGPSMGMYTGHVDPSQWMEQFGIHVYHRGQLHLAELAKRIDESRVKKGLKWLESVAGEIKWDGKMLTPGLDGTLARQIRLYLAIKDFVKEEGIDFLGLTGQLDFTEWENYCTMDLPEALLNDIADWEEEEKKPIITATECDSNGALTMQILHLLSGTPVLFADLRHYHKDLDLFDLVNSGQHAPWFAKRSGNYRENWKEITLYPASEFYLKGGGASVAFYGAPADMVTYARIVRVEGQFVMHIFTGSFVELPKEKMEKLAKETTYEWPHIFAKFDVDYENFADTFSANHIHATIGYYIPELIAVCESLGIKPIVIREKL